VNITPIRTEADLLAALAEVDQLNEEDPAPGTSAGDKLDVLSTLIEAYRTQSFPD